MFQNIFHHQGSGSGDSGTFSAQKKKRNLPVSRDIILFGVVIIGLIVLYFVLQEWRSRSDESFQEAVVEYEQAFTEIQNEEFDQAALFVSKAGALVKILDSSPSFIPVVQKFTESIHRDVALEEIGIEIENNKVRIAVKANAYDVFSLGQQYLVWRDKSPWVESATLDSMTVDTVTQIVHFTATISSTISLLEDEQEN